ncbi:hydroxyisourate hydrolase [Niveispirillum irakense]|uniref:hydroxyisourate hydrolase n=1 Tax=Niveispirillum irakense TaxID=34011 RepID=UPI000490AD29|nr:hydroxyisourate hydrolase [Niveispirillum irakense]
MARLSTHILDTCHGGPAAGVHIQLFRLHPDGTRTPLTERVSNADGRTDQPLLSGAEMAAGRYELVFHIGDYFAGRDATLAEPAFLTDVPVRFTISDPTGHYHIPLLATPWSYSTYRGS